MTGKELILYIGSMVSIFVGFVMLLDSWGYGSNPIFGWILLIGGGIVYFAVLPAVKRSDQEYIERKIREDK